MSQSYSFGQAPREVIEQAVKSQCPNGYPMTLRCKDEWAALAAAWNEGIDAHLEAMTERSEADASSGYVLVHPEELSTLLRRLYEGDTEEGWSLRSGILSTLGIEEV